MEQESAEQNRTLNGILSAYGVTYHGSDYVREQLPQHYNNGDQADPDMMVDAFGKKEDPYA